MLLECDRKHAVILHCKSICKNHLEVDLANISVSSSIHMKGQIKEG